MQKNKPQRHEGLAKFLKKNFVVLRCLWPLCGCSNQAYYTVNTFFD